jgi:hypothetical protein
MALNQAALLAKLEANALRLKEVNRIAAELSATLNTREPEVVGNVAVDLQQRPLPVGKPQG